MTKPEHLEAYFLVPLAEVFGVPLPALRNALARRCPQGLTPEQLQAAAERIIDTRKARGYPAPIEVLGFLERASSPAEPKAQITAANYAEVAKAYCKRNGPPTVIGRLSDKQSWIEWRAYFRRIGYKASLGRMEEIGRWTVPAAFPHQFDATFPALYDAAADHSPPEDVARVKAGFTRLQKELAAAWDAGLDKRSPTYKPPHQREADEKAEAKRRLDNPVGLSDVKLSPEAQAKFTPPDQQPEEKGSAA